MRLRVFCPSQVVGPFLSVVPVWRASLSACRVWSCAAVVKQSGLVFSCCACQSCGITISHLGYTIRFCCLLLQSGAVSLAGLVSFLLCGNAVWRVIRVRGKISVILCPTSQSKGLPAVPAGKVNFYQRLVASL